jgi:hypothetical protein
MVEKKKRVTPRKVAPKRRAPSGVVGQIRVAFNKANRLATSAGFLLGGFVPIAAFEICHFELPQEQGLAWAALACLVLGGLVFSAKTVWQWAAAAFLDRAKATGFVLLLEGVMVLSHTSWLSYSALAYLILINGIATGVTVSKERAA